MFKQKTGSGNFLSEATPHRSVSIGIFVMSKRRLREYHLICRTTGQSYGGFVTLTGAREYAREEKLEAWDIFHGNRLVERRELAPLDSPASDWAERQGEDLNWWLRDLVAPAGTSLH